MISCKLWLLIIFKNMIEQNNLGDWMAADAKEFRRITDRKETTRKKLPDLMKDWPYEKLSRVAATLSTESMDNIVKKMKRPGEFAKIVWWIAYYMRGDDALKEVAKKAINEFRMTTGKMIFPMDVAGLGLETGAHKGNS